MEEREHRTESSSFSKQLALKLVKLRYERGFTQEDVAYRAGIAIYTYQKFEKGESKPGTPMNPRLHTLLALSEALGITIQELLTFP